MTTNTTIYQDRERTLINIVRVLPPNRVEQLVDFARFLEAQVFGQEFTREEDLVTTDADDARWDALLATDEGQTLLDRLAGEALAEHQAGKTTTNGARQWTENWPSRRV